MVLLQVLSRPCDLSTRLFKGLYRVECFLEHEGWSLISRPWHPGFSSDGLLFVVVSLGCFGTSFNQLGGMGL